MRISFELAAEFRDTEGKGASRRLRHAGRVPAILYGGHAEPRAITLNHQKLMTLVDNEKFYSSIINLVVGDKKQAAIVKDLQMHPARNAIVHVDLQRVVETEKIRIHIPIHFKGEAAAPGVKSQGGVVSHRIADVEISCLPKDLPEFIELDLSQDGDERVEASVRSAAAGRRHDPVDRQGRRRGRHRSSAACGRGGTDRRSRCRDACRRRRCCSGRRCGRCAGAKAGDAKADAKGGAAKGAAAAAPAKKEGGKK